MNEQSFHLFHAGETGISSCSVAFCFFFFFEITLPSTMEVFSRSQYWRSQDERRNYNQQDNEHENLDISRFQHETAARNYRWRHNCRLND